MKTSAKWISENNYILNNSKYLNIAVTDPIKREDNYEVNCLDLVLMAFAGCITAEFKKQVIKHSVILKSIETDVVIDRLQDTHPGFSIHVICKVKTNARIKYLEDCINRAVKTSFLGILFQKSEIKINTEIVLTPIASYYESFAG